MKKIVFISLLLFGSIPFVKGQMLNANYQMSVPLGKINDYTGKMSFRGANLEYHYFLSNQLSIGGMVGWNVWYKDKGMVSQNFLVGSNKETYTITGHQYRYVNTVPIMAMGRYWFNEGNSLLQPYAGIGLGMSWTEMKTDVGQYTSTNSRWQFAFAPEIGTLIHVNDQFAFNLGAKYTYGTKAGHGRVPAMQNFTISVGIVLKGVE